MFPVLLFLLAQTVPGGYPGLCRSRLPRSPLEERPASFSMVSSLHGGRGDKVMVVVADYLAEPLSFHLSRFAGDLASEGWDVETHVMAGGTAEDLKALFQNTPGLDGAILVGFLPCAWFEESHWAAEEFPCELFLMDLNGVWTDTDGNGFYDSHTGHVAPEIWLGRIDASAMAYGSETAMLAEYFDKNHLYRTGSMALNSRALTFIDNDWSSWYSTCGLQAIYGTSGVTVVNSPSQTTAANYLSRLAEGYEFVHLMSHSSPWGHTFLLPGGGHGGTVMAPEISQVNPQTGFYQLFSCSNARWVESGCLGNWYLFGTSWGLLISGSAKTGSMLDFPQFYSPVGSGATFGEAFRSWWQYQAQGGFSNQQRAWFYGNALLGDPTLRPLASSGSSTRIPPGGSFRSYDRVSSSQHSDCHPAAAAGPGDLTVVAWLTGENGRLDIAARLIEGDSWSQVYYVDSDEYWDAGVTAAFDGDGTPWLAWSDFQYETYSYRIKTAHGHSFENVQIRVPQNGYQVFPRLAWDGERMWLAWLNWEATGGEVMVKALDGSFPAQAISPPGAFCAPPALAAEAGAVHLAWVEQTPSGSTVMWSSGSGGAFSTPVAASSGTVCHSPFLAFAEGEPLLVWQDDTSGSSSIRGCHPPGEEFIVASTENQAFRPVAGTSSQAGTVVYWQEGRDASARIMASTIPDGEPFQIVHPEGPAWLPYPAGDRLFWAGNPGEGWNIYTALPDWTGIGEETPTPAAQAPALASNPVRGSLLLSLPGQAPAFSGTLRIFDIAGRLVLRTDILLKPGQTVDLDCSHLPSGVYLLRAGEGGTGQRFTILAR